MKNHTNLFKDELIKMGRRNESIVTYNGTQYIDELLRCNPHFEGGILKSIMKQFDFTATTSFPVGAVINYQLGLLVNGEYEFLDYGNYVVTSVEKSEDTNSYTMTCYDKMIYSMVPVEDLGLTFPVTMRTYYEAVATHLGLQVETSSFNNQTQMILGDPFTGLNYTWRDVLDQLAEASGGIVRISSNDKLEVIYPTQCNDTIDEEFFDETNVRFDKKYGPVNSVVLSRSAESDNIYRRDEESIAENGLCEIKIKDNQFMNFNNRVNFIDGILSAVDGLYFYMNDVSTKGVLYYEPGDLYYISIGENTYQCLMLNDDIEIENGITENIHTDEPEEAVTDYTKADKTDIRINQTTLIVDKQNQSIEGLITSVGEQNQKIVQITADIEEIKSEIGDIADVTETKQGYGYLEFDDVNQSEPVYLNIHPVIDDILRVDPRDDLYPSDTLIPHDIHLWFRLKKNNSSIPYPKTNLYPSTSLLPNGYEKIINYELPDELLYLDANTYDELILDYANQECYIIKRVGRNNQGTKVAITETRVDYPYPTIALDEGDYKIELLHQPTAYIYLRLMKKNIYTDQFATKIEVDTKIEQTSQQITLEVDEKLTNYVTETEMTSALTMTADSINTEVRKKVGKDEIISQINQTAEQVQINANKISLAGKTLNLGQGMSIVSSNFNVDSSGNAEMSSLNITNQDLLIKGSDVARINLKPNTPSGTFDFSQVSISVSREGYSRIALSSHYFFEDVWIRSRTESGGDAQMYIAGPINATAFNPTSDARLKTNIKEYKDSALDIVKKSKVYEYNMKDSGKHEIGLVIGEGYECDDVLKEKIPDVDTFSINLYRMTSVLWKAVQEQQEQIEALKKEIEILKGEK